MIIDQGPKKGTEGPLMMTVRGPWTEDQGPQKETWPQMKVKGTLMKVKGPWKEDQGRQNGIKGPLPQDQGLRRGQNVLGKRTRDLGKGQRAL